MLCFWQGSVGGILFNVVFIILIMDAVEMYDDFSDVISSEESIDRIPVLDIIKRYSPDRFLYLTLWRLMQR